MPSQTPLVKLSQMFAWGTPRFNIGITLTTTLFTLLLVVNTITAKRSVNKVYPLSKENEKQTLNCDIWDRGISYIISSLFSTIETVPLSTSTGFI
ncbi:purine/pyrimidine permease [Bacillus cereus]|nr:purine/pyrimidine permease [Bacillus cereus]EEL08918.1 Xanthine permease [Bacillus cereus BDRD-Cer4]MCC3288493.1 purine/pyrimidine permease [Bacillus cereus]MEB9997501.1 purine/pyrimidine permease [Bacillus cereus]QCX96868.1 xanthine permease [Bacillus cereus ATCC 14579]HDR4694415.1 purine/pyrimidine permease [Bacillus cereus]